MSIPSPLRAAAVAAILLAGSFVAPPLVAAQPRDPAAPERVSLDLVDSDIVDVLRYFSEISGLNLIVDRGVKGPVTLRLIDVPWDQALDVVLRSRGLGYELEGNVLWIARVATLTRQAAEEAAHAEAALTAGPLETMMVRVSYADPQEIARILGASGALSRRGSVTVDERTATLIITDVLSAATRAASTARSLDR